MTVMELESAKQLLLDEFALQECLFIERACAHLLAGWTVKVPLFEDKSDLAMFAHQHMRRASLLTDFFELLAPLWGAPKVATDKRDAARFVDSASDPETFLAGYSWFLARLRAGYQTILPELDPLACTVLLEEMALTHLPNLDSQLEWVHQKQLPLCDQFLETLTRIWCHKGDTAQIAMKDALWSPLDRVFEPARPSASEQGRPGAWVPIPENPFELANDYGTYLYNWVTAEYATLELVLRNSYEHPDMPWAFHQDMLEQAYDEGRHTKIFCAICQSCGLPYGSMPVSLMTYQQSYLFEGVEPGSSKELFYRLLTTQNVREIGPIQSFYSEVQNRTNLGQMELVRMYDQLMNDEAQHVKWGLRWILFHNQNRDQVLYERDLANQSRNQFYGQRRAEYIRRDPHAFVAEAMAHKRLREQAKSLGIQKIFVPEHFYRLGVTEQDLKQYIDWGYILVPQEEEVSL